MKALMLFAVIALFAAAVQAQDAPPKAVDDAFKAKFAKAEDVEWGKESAEEWEAEFTMNGKEMTASFSPSGTWMGTETEMMIGDLPKNVTKSLAEKFKGYRIEEAEEIEKPDFKGYEVLLEKGDTEVEALVTAAGVVTVKESRTKDKDDENDEDESMDD